LDEATMNRAWTLPFRRRVGQDGRVTQSVVERTTAAIEQLAALESTIGAVAALDPERSLSDAAASDARIDAGAPRPLEGVPIAVKDWIDVAGWPITGATASASARDRRPTADATAVARLRAAGAVVVAITRALADNAIQGRTLNPRDQTRAPGGSSSGSAAVVAAGAVPISLGSDSGGSIRLPAAWCGVAGLKPTFGRVPLTGHFPRCGALEDGRTVIGPIANRVDDLAQVLAIIAGPDGLDAAAAPVPVEPEPRDVSGLRVGVFDDSLRSALAASGLGVVDDVVPDARDEALEITRRYWKRSELTGADVVQLYWDWDRFRRRMAIATARFDAMVTPAAVMPPPQWRESEEADYEWLLPWSLTGSPAVVVPLGAGAVQVIAQPWCDHIALAVASAIEASNV
jgi:amidase